MRALQRQCYALATLRLRAAVDQAGGGAGLAILSDIDETILDNSAVMAAAMHNEGMFQNLDTWLLWEREGNPHLIPGAAEFFALADSLGVTIFYVSDRFEENKLATIATLSRLGLPQVCAEQVLLFGPPKARAARRLKAATGSSCSLATRCTISMARSPAPRWRISTA
ncbi:HAD family acid phosphatase [Paracoccus sp. PAMC 22219]|uniref:HAD family acid phosphatase n=1 Tax=Paracoccus sp. PAMC 22219 TaxID=1569209 RepID=UPI000695AD8F|nr:HAD family acid phosphatase [Paracoccus sp. PAMC 22219]